MGIPEVFELTMLPGRRPASTRARSSRLTSSFSTTASRIQSAPLSRASPASKLVVEMSLCVSGVKKGSGFSPRARFSPCSAASAVTSSSSDGTPAFAKCAAIWAPITPAPSTATELITRSVYAPLTSFGYGRQLARVTEILPSPERGENSTTGCLNCGASLTGAFCAACGQRVVPPHPTAKELVGELYDELAGWDGKFARTIRLLLTQPGELTRAVIEGQRTRYVKAVRLYLICSVLFFLVQASAPLPDTNVDVEIGFGVGVSAAADQTPGERALGKAMTGGFGSLTQAERADLDREVEAQPRFVRPMLRAMAKDYDGLMRRASETTPRVLFVLIPALALILALFYRGRHYPEHLYFATHFGTFVFIVLTIETVVAYTRSLPAIFAAQAIGALVILVYGVIAQRRVYGGSWVATGAKAFGVAVIYGTLWSAAVLAVTLWASRSS